MTNSREPRSVSYRGLVILFILVVLFLCLGVGVRADFDEVIDSPMYRNPDLPIVRQVVKFAEEIKTLWSRALARPDTEMKCRIAHAIIEAHHRGIKGMETTIPALVVECERADQPLAVRLAVARALIELDAREAAARLFEQARSGNGDMRDCIEPALARWDHRPARPMWLQRLRDPSTPHRELVLAIRGLAGVGEKEASNRLLEIVLDTHVHGPIRVEAARGLAKLRMEGLETDAERLAADASPRAIVPRLAAASLLRHHRSPESIRILQKLSRDAEPTVAAVAVARLFEIDPELLVPALDDLLANPDAALRSSAVDVLHRRTTEKHLRLLSERLDDAHLEVRRKARRYLLELAKEEKWHKQVIADATTMLKSGRWRGQEQATILLTQLDQKQVAGRLVELLRFDRAEVKVTAAWGLRKLDVPQTLPDVVRYIEDDLKPRPNPKAPPAVVGGRRVVNAPAPEEQPILEIRDHTLSQLHQFLGQRKYRPAEALLRRFVPKFAFGFVGESRAAAIWALGMIHEGKTDDALVEALEERLNDVGSRPPEDYRVRWMCAIALGRMKAKSTLASLRQWCQLFKPTGEPVTNACGWAIEQITGQRMPPPETSIRYQPDWFLIPDQWKPTPEPPRPTR